MTNQALTLNDEVLGGLQHAPHDDAGVERARRHAAPVGAKRRAVHTRRVEAPLLVVSQLGNSNLLINKSFKLVAIIKQYHFESPRR